MPTILAAQMSLVPHRRLGSLLERRREGYGLSIDDMARRSGGRFSSSELAVIEAGGRELDDSAIEALGLLYEFNSTPPIPQRSKLIIAADEASGMVEEWTEQSIREVFVRYLALVYLLRNRSLTEVLPMRTDDLQVIAQAFSTGTDVVQAALEELMGSEKAAIGTQMDLLRRRLMVPAAGMFVGPTPQGSLILVK